jgi:hypothetical protein
LHPHLCISTVECRLATIAGVPMSTMCVVWLGGCEGAKCEFVCVSSVRCIHSASSLDHDLYEGHVSCSFVCARVRVYEDCNHTMQA